MARAPAGAGEPIEIDRRSLLRFRFRRHDLHRDPRSLGAASDVALLDYGVQDTGADGAAWALAVRGAPAPEDGELAWAWTLRGAPHAYRRANLAAVAVATAPFSEADAAKRIFDASKPLKEADIPVLDALAIVAARERAVVTKPTVKGDLSSRLTEVLDEPFLRECRPCQAVHAFEQPFRLAALQAGLELEPGTSPPVLRRAKGLKPLRFGTPGTEAEARFDVVRNHLQFYPGASQRGVATFVDIPLKEVKAHWPEDVVEVQVGGSSSAGGPDARWALADDAEALVEAASSRSSRRAEAVRLLGTHDPFVQLRDRELLVPDEDRRKDLWRVIGRPGAVVADGEMVATWRPRTTKGRVTLLIDPWTQLTAATRALVEEQAERLAAHRDVALAGLDVAS